MAKDKQTGSATLSREEPAKKTTVTPTVAPKSSPTRPISGEPLRPSPATALPFGKQNYLFMLIGIGVILAGFFIMSLDKEEFGFGFLGLTLGPIVVMSGFVLEFVAILTRPKA
ncbi:MULTISPECIES: DUF3098 domain-containing protein [unclassified Spirosoma]|uniref:DUF3098 domain-containing protein n=1 Tax=unclassified Spirosoma TaxID=2621999 RepID=UPI00095E1432|nr:MULTISPECIES: DUF3098 domain-containing protein [unclassified Spirosoma]MBN8825114.1 DUF3098 domain-containing protein [Spirosoma sp.]OJW77194.1 MAG: hypothetical protein BGO59_31570 [Spirosoma sp. 48-14]